MKLSKFIPARTKTITFRWLSRKYLVMGKSYRKLRKSLRDPMDKCKWCNQPFEDGDDINLASAIETKKNLVLCNGCSDELAASMPEDVRDKQFIQNSDVK